MVKLQENKERFFISVPKEYVEQAGWSKGEILTVSFNERGNIELSNKKK